MRWAYGVLAAGVVLGVWQAVVWGMEMPPFILPSPLRVAEAFWQNRLILLGHAGVTLAEVLLGLLIGSVLGAGTAIAIAGSERLSRLVMPLLVLTQAVPVFALAPILTLWFGYGMASKVLMAVLIIFFPVTSAFHDGLTRIPKGLRDLARTMNATPFQEMLRLRIPHALPSLATGLKMGAVYAPIGAVIGEWVGASQGLGYLMLLANGRAKTDLMFASLLLLALMTVTLYQVVSWAADRASFRDKDLHAA
ncbi:ABC transporter permease [Shimia aestuarii]|uniref:ABC transporter permease n=1 Tax=Shimia aestuarii TaxID=254406 RepID=UPI001FB555F7|nr:ABC transporter permease [Shimia aestuarii]